MKTLYLKKPVMTISNLITFYYISSAGISSPLSLYGLPEIRETDFPLRPIVSTIGSPTYALTTHWWSSEAVHCWNGLVCSEFETLHRERTEHSSRTTRHLRQFWCGVCIHNEACTWIYSIVASRLYYYGAVSSNKLIGSLWEACCVRWSKTLMWRDLNRQHSSPLWWSHRIGFVRRHIRRTEEFENVLPHICPCIRFTMKKEKTTILFRCTRHEERYPRAGAHCLQEINTRIAICI